MPIPPPPTRPTPEEIKRRMIAGAKTVQQIDPRFWNWYRDSRRRIRIQFWLFLSATLLGIIISIILCLT